MRTEVDRDVRPSKASLIVSILALVVSMAGVAFGRLAWHEASRSADASEQANALTQKQARVALETAKRRVALRVFIGEAPVKYEPKGETRWAVYNASPVDVTQAWVKATRRNGRSAIIALESIQRCHVYILDHYQAEFRPTRFELYFFDGSEYWQRRFDGHLSLQKTDRPVPRRELSRPADAELITGSCGT